MEKTIRGFSLHNQILMIVFLWFISVPFVNAQSTDVINITGKVSDETGMGLPGATIKVKGTMIGAVADIDGNFQISAPKPSSLTISFIGYVTQEVAVNGRSIINLQLEPDIGALDEFVVVGYGTIKRADLTGSIASVKGEDLAITPVPTFDMALQGRAPGVQITSASGEPGGDVTIRIRGNNSISGDNQPLLVIDGYPMPAGGEASAAGVTDGRNLSSNLLSFLNPAEIESIDILKDASATAIYGSRGANGVIIVTTKRGKFGQSAQINLTSEFGFSEIPQFPKLLDGPTYAQWRNDESRFLGGEILFDGINRPLPADVQTTDWLDRVLRTGYNQRYQIDASGGNEKTRYYISGNYIANEGILKHTSFERGNIRMNLDTELSKRLTVRTSINYAETLNKRSNEGSGAIINSGAIFQAFKNSPTATPGELIDQGDGTTDFFVDPLVELSDRKDETANRNLLINLNLNYKITDDLDFNLIAGTNSVNSRREVFFPKTTRIGLLFDSRGVYNVFEGRDLIMESYFSYNKVFNEKHNLNLVAGYSWQDNTARSLNVRVEGFPTDALSTDNLGFGLIPSIPTSNRLQRTLVSFYTRMNYNYDNRYYLSLSGRTDGSSVFAQNNKWGFFPSAALAWTLSNESFLQNSTALSMLKLRTSYGVTGSQSISPLQSLTLLGVRNAVFGDQLFSGLAPTQIGNSNLKWETTSQFNVGLDLGFLSDRIYSNIDYYVKTTSDLLQTFPLPTSAGIGFIIANSGTIENRGIEILIGGYVVDNRNFKWNTNFNWSNNKAVIKDLGDTPEIFGPSPARNIVTEPSNIMRPGEVFGAMYGYNIIGLIQPGDTDIPLFGAYDRPGSWKYEDVNGDGRITADDRVIIGNPNPDFIFGWNNDFIYKRFSLSVFVQGVVGNDIMNINRLFMASGRVENNAFREWYENRWSEENPHNDVRNPSSVLQTQLQPSSAIVEDGSYVRLKNISLGYQFDLKRMKNIRDARIYVTGTNLLTFTNYTGFDPEVNMFGNNNLAQGIDFATYPRNRMFTLGVTVGF